jgi:GxxExxY protein
MRVHTELGPGLLESTYTACLQYELSRAGVQSATQVGLPVVYCGVKLELGYRIDLLAEDLVGCGDQVGRGRLSGASGANPFVPQTQW